MPFFIEPKRAGNGQWDNALLTMSAYIDLNAVRAGIVDDPKDYIANSKIKG